MSANFMYKKNFVNASERFTLLRLKKKAEKLKKQFAKQEKAFLRKGIRLNGQFERKKFY